MIRFMKHALFSGMLGALYFCVGALPLVADAATLQFGGATQGTVGSTLTIPITVSAAQGESVNAVSATVRFPAALLEATSMSSSGSIVNFWVQQPSFSASAGTAELEGVILNPGFSSQQGIVATLTFRVRAAGAATLSFSSASVLANDGAGSNILTASPSKTLTLTAPEVKKEEQKKIEPTTGSAEEKKPIEVVPPPVREATSTLEISPIQDDVPATSTYQTHPAPSFGYALPLATGLAILGWLIILARFLFDRRAKVPPLKRIAAADRALHQALKDLRSDLSHELKHLRAKEDAGTLTVEERHILKRFAGAMNEFDKIDSDSDRA